MVTDPFVPGETTLSVILPCYNEGENIVATVSEATDALQKMGIENQEILIVDDGSVDETALLARELGEADARVKLVQHTKNEGYGEALQSGIGAAIGDWIFITDGDRQFHFEDLQEMIPLTHRADFCQGIRIKRADPMARVIIGKVYKSIIRMLFRVPVADPECSFRLVRAGLIKDVDLRCHGALVPLELVLRAEERGAVFGEHGVRHRVREHGTSSAMTVPVFVVLVRELVMLRWRIGRDNVPDHHS